MRLITFGQDLLKIATVLAEVADAAEPIVDVTNPAIAQIYNLSAQQGTALLTALLAQNSVSPQAAIATPAPTPAVLVPDPAPAEPASEEVRLGPGLHAVVPA